MDMAMRVSLSAALLLSLLTLSADGVNKLLEPTDDVVTPHIAWAKPSEGGSLRVLFITHRAAMREIVELSQRFDIEREVFCTERQGDFSLPPLARLDDLRGA